MKHAFLIIAHNEYPVLEVLLSMLDDERNDIYLHIDKRATGKHSASCVFFSPLFLPTFVASL